MSPNYRRPLYTPYYRHWVRLLQVLARYIARRGKALQGLNVLELGSGTGLVGLVAGYFGAQVYITDQACAPLSPNPAFHHRFQRQIARSNHGA
jgi:predicted nicotinamide N-methyase